ncbi:sigma-70 family RNA polymerase sigma factor [Oceanirhabdus sp. W0125-5]|uniref:sigma-70 family RNA polymerase sigma factor n=1 Tax=Oceanirhabdus sp. W0125-5 TaxID=2999116 RepID=UPI0022F31598|nr:sigma-70 family RNA polymerase sigma factor [Oceanirhabdus sp. W0125-5]WBW96784.1 sigma-70 family RNA polymerase sigma factor [Oceanirhabdus sp. W0125-5]
MKIKNVELRVFLERAKNGEEEALGEIIELFKGYIIKEALRYKIPSMEFDDIVQYGYLTVLKCIKSYKLESNSFYGYVIRGIKNNFNYMVRKHKTNRVVYYDNEIVDIMGVDEFSIEEHIMIYEDVKWLREIIDTLSEEEQELIKCYFLEGMKLVNYAKVKGIPYSTMIYKKKELLKKLQGFYCNNK